MPGPADTDECIRAAVRFATGTAVECCVGQDTWVPGTVVAHYYRENNWPAQLLAPYRVRIETDDESVVHIWAPLDTDECIRVADDDDTPVLGAGASEAGESEAGESKG